MCLDQRADLITPAEFSQDSELGQFIHSRIFQILQRYEASEIESVIDKVSAALLTS